MQCDEEILTEDRNRPARQYNVPPYVELSIDQPMRRYKNVSFTRRRLGTHHSQIFHIPSDEESRISDGVGPNAYLALFYVRDRLGENAFWSGKALLV